MAIALDCDMEIMREIEIAICDVTVQAVPQTSLPFILSTVKMDVATEIMHNSTTLGREPMAQHSLCGQQSQYTCKSKPIALGTSLVTDTEASLRSSNGDLLSPTKSGDQNLTTCSDKSTQAKESYKVDSRSQALQIVDINTDSASCSDGDLSVSSLSDSSNATCRWCAEVRIFSSRRGTRASDDGASDDEGVAFLDFEGFSEDG